MPTNIDAATRMNLRKLYKLELYRLLSTDMAPEEAQAIAMRRVQSYATNAVTA